MTYQVLARKWRPKQFEDVIGQEHVTKTLRNSVLKKQIGHAYLLTGTRGVGKTTIARIFAKAIRCEDLTASGNPCLKCNSCLSVDDGNSLDYIEIDGASNTGVDNIRDLIDNAQYLPTSGDHKVYVIDEVHMLSVNAFNALLKTLEEPPEHVVFVFATTEPHKLLGTVLSRVQRFDFKSVSIPNLVSHVEMIAKAEEIEFESQELIKELAKHGKGSVRDTLSLMDQIMSLSVDKKITEDVLLMSLGLANTRSLSTLLTGLFTGNKAECVKAFDSILSENIDLEKFVLQVLDSLFEMIESLDPKNNITSTVVDKRAIETLSTPELLWMYEVLAKDFEWAMKSLDPEKSISFVLIKVALREQIINPLPRAVVQETQEFAQYEITQDVPNETEELPVEVKVVEPKIIIEKNWKNFLSFSMTQYKAIGSNLERGNLLKPIDLNSKKLTIELGIIEANNIFNEYLSSPENKEKINEMLKEFFEKDEVFFKITMLNAEEKEKKNFSSVAEIDDKKIADAIDAKRERIKNNEYILKAQELFNSSIDKIIVNKD